MPGQNASVAWVLAICILLILEHTVPIFAKTSPHQHQSARIEKKLDSDVKEFRFEALETSLAALPPGPERDYFAGILANRTGHVEESIRLLRSSIPQLKISQPKRAAIALESLADDYTKSYRYADAANTYDDLLGHYANKLGHEERQSVKDDSGVVQLLKTSPPQTILWSRPVRLKTEHDSIGAIDTVLTVNGVHAPWLLDTGANMSVVSASFAQRLGLHPLPGYAQTMGGLTGIENRMQVAVLPTLQIGGATLHNLVLLVLDDKSLKIETGKKPYQIQAILGFPAFQAMGAITFLQDGEFEAGATAVPPGPTARMFLDELTPLIECGLDGKDLIFSFDTGANGSTFSVRYFDEFHTQVESLKKAAMEAYGAGGGRRTDIHLLPNVTLQIAGKTVVLRHVPISTAPVGSDIDQVYGNLGRDLVAGFESFTLDFTNMTFSLGKELSPKPKH